MDREVFHTLLWAWTGLGLLTFFLLLFITAPYGRHSRRDWGPRIPNRAGWILMEFPSLLVFVLSFLLGPGKPEALTWIFFACYVWHYSNRSILYPLRTHTRGKQMPLVVALLAVLFNLVNGFINGYWFPAFAPEYGWAWLGSFRFMGGFILFAGGALINWWSDQILLNLRKGGKSGYYIPKGFLFRWVSCPNFLGEIIQWSGFALMTWSPAALVFALWSFFNLVPRALDHHRWYRKTFPDYPPDRRAILPFIL